MTEMSLLGWWIVLRGEWLIAEGRHWWVLLVNVVAAVVSERVHNSCVWRRSLSLHEARKREDERRGGMRLEEGVCGEVCRSQYTEGEQGRLCCHGVACRVGGSKRVLSSGREEAEEEQMACPRKGSWL